MKRHTRFPFLRYTPWLWLILWVGGLSIPAPGNVQNVSLHLGLGGYQCAWDKPEDLPKVRRVADLIYRTFGWRAPQFPDDFTAIEGQRHSAKLPDLVKKHGSFDRFLAHEKVFSYVIPNKDRVNYTTGIVMRNT